MGKHCKQIYTRFRVEHSQGFIYNHNLIFLQFRNYSQVWANADVYFFGQNYNFLHISLPLTIFHHPLVIEGLMLYFLIW